MAAGSHTRSGVRTATVVVTAALLFGLALAGIWAANTLLWFGPDPAPRDYARERYELALAAAGVQSEDENAWSVLDETVELLRQAERAAPRPDRTGPDVAEDDEAKVEYDLALAGDAASAPAMVLAEFDRLGGFERLAALADAKAALRPPAPAAEPGGVITSDLPGLRQFARALAFKFVADYRAGDEAGAIATFRRGMALARLRSHDPVIIGRLVAIAIGHLVLTTAAEEIVSRRPGAETLEAMLNAIEQQPLAPVRLTLSGERLFALEMLHGTLPSSRLKLRSRGAQMEKVNEFFDLAIPFAELPRAERTPAAAGQLHGFSNGLGKMYLPASMLLPSVQKVLLVNDQWETTVAGVRLMLAIELHAARTGQLPEALEELAPSILASVPRDPFSARGFVYRRIDPAQDPFGRSYLLYSVALDGEDNGGRAHPKDPAVAFSSAGAGTDFVINAPRPQAPPRGE